MKATNIGEPQRETTLEPIIEPVPEAVPVELPAKEVPVGVPA